MNNQKSGFPEFIPVNNPSADTPEQERAGPVPSSGVISNFQKPQPTSQLHAQTSGEPAAVSVPAFIRGPQTTSISVEALFPNSDTNPVRPTKEARDAMLNFATTHRK